MDYFQKWEERENKVDQQIKTVYEQQTCPITQILVELKNHVGSRMTGVTMKTWVDAIKKEAIELEELERFLEDFKSNKIDNKKFKLSIFNLIEYINKKRDSKEKKFYNSTQTGKTYEASERGYAQEKIDIDNMPMGDRDIHNWNRWFKGSKILTNSGRSCDG